MPLIESTQIDLVWPNQVGMTALFFESALLSVGEHFNLSNLITHFKSMNFLTDITRSMMSV